MKKKQLIVNYFVVQHVQQSFESDSASIIIYHNKIPKNTVKSRCLVELFKITCQKESYRGYRKNYQMFCKNYMKSISAWGLFLVKMSHNCFFLLRA